MSNAPSRNPASNDSLPGLLKFFLKTVQKRTDCCLPATILEYSPSANRAQISPALVQITTGNAQISRGQLASVPVLQMGGGKFVQYFPVGTGDTGWIIACDRDISIFKKTYKKSPPNTYRLHDFADSWFVPDTMLNGVTIAPEDIQNSVWQNYAGTVKIALWNNLIKILSINGVGIGGTPNPNAILDLQSTTQAFILPRMTTVQKSAIPSPVAGMMVWDTTEDGVSTYNGSVWS